MGCDDAYGPVGSTSDARKRLEEGRAELNRREAERWRAEANFGEREDEWTEDFPEPEWHKAKSDEYVPSIPSTSEYIRSLCRKNKDLEAEIAKMRPLANAIWNLAKSDGSYSTEIAGVRIEKCDEYGQTRTTIERDLIKSAAAQRDAYRIQRDHAVRRLKHLMDEIRDFWPDSHPKPQGYFDLDVSN